MYSFEHLLIKGLIKYSGIDFEQSTNIYCIFIENSLPPYAFA